MNDRDGTKYFAVALRVKRKEVAEHAEVLHLREHVLHLHRVMAALASELTPLRERPVEGLGAVLVGLVGVAMSSTAHNAAP